MAISRLAASNPSADTNVLLYTGLRTVLVSVIATNKSNVSGNVRVWVVPFEQDADASAYSYVSYDTEVSAKNSLESFRFPVLVGDKVYVRSNIGDMSFLLSGIDDTNIAGIELQELQASISTAQSTANSAGTVANSALVLALIGI